MVEFAARRRVRSLRRIYVRRPDGFRTVSGEIMIPARLPGDRWAGNAQRWFFSLFDDLWELRNKTQHGSDPVTQKQIRLARCERAIRRLYAASSTLPYHERHPFRDPIETLLSTTLFDQEMWISKTETYLPKAFRRAAQRGNSQKAITEYFQRVPPAVADRSITSHPS